VTLLSWRAKAMDVKLKQTDPRGNLVNVLQNIDSITGEISDQEVRYTNAFNSIVAYILQRSIITDQSGKRSQ
jgi:hypothetical protein